MYHYAIEKPTIDGDYNVDLFVTKTAAMGAWNRAMSFYMSGVGRKPISLVQGNFKYRLNRSIECFGKVFRLENADNVAQLTYCGTAHLNDGVNPDSKGWPKIEANNLDGDDYRVLELINGGFPII